jgi:radical S-adenosyl methionine domain-containing protein 2
LLIIAGQYLDILAISCDSFDEATNKAIGRGQGNRSHVDKLMKIRGWCHKYEVAFKVNTVVNTYNFEEDMTEHIRTLSPVRWKVM